MVAPLRTDPGDEERSESIDSWCNDFVTSPGLGELVRMFHGAIPPSSRVDYLAEFARERWDFRRRTGRSVERNLVDAVVESGLAEAVLDVAGELGLVNQAKVSGKSYDLVLVLGGLVRACIQRPQLAAEICQEVEAPTVFGLGGFRSLVGDENDLVASAGLREVDNEAGAMCLGMELAFGLSSYDEERSTATANPNEAWQVRRYRDVEPFRQVGVVVAPSTEPEVRRANTADTYRFMAERIAKLTAKSSVLIVTTAIYVPYQNLEAQKVLGMAYNCGVETVGVTAAQSFPDMPPQVFTAANYLQEINSTLQSIQGWTRSQAAQSRRSP